MAIANLREFHAAIDRLEQRVVLMARQTVARAADEIIAKAMKNFDGAHRKGQPHVGGDKPNVVTGTLRRSIHHTVLQAFEGGMGGWETMVGPATVYARRIELGYPGGDSAPGHQHTRAFPYFRPAADEVAKDLTGIAALTWKEFMR